MRIPVNLNEVEELAPVVPGDEYESKVTDVKTMVTGEGREASETELVEAADKGSLEGFFLAWTAEVMVGDYVGKNLWWNTSLKPKAQWNVKKMFDTAGVPYEEDDFESTDMIGASLILIVEEDSYQGKPKNNVVGYLPVSG